jgi:hypothetical protein
MIFPLLFFEKTDYFIYLIEYWEVLSIEYVS